MKAEAKEEIKLASNAIKTLGGVIRRTVQFKLYNDECDRTLILIEKVCNTNVKYPRKYSEIKKKPL